MATLHQYILNFFTLPQMAELLLRIVLATLCGAVLGLERTKRFKEAGVRTYLLVACSAAAIMIVSKYGFVDIALASLPGARDADGARLAAQVVSGIGFLGAGMIFRHDNKVSGLTTAAGIWATAGIGLAFGAGMYIIGLFTTVLILLLQFVMHRFSFRKDAMVSQVITVTVSEPAAFREDMLAHLKTCDCTIIGSQITRSTDGSFTYKFRTRCGAGDRTDDILPWLEARKDVVCYSLNTME